MSDDLRGQIYRNLESKETDELLEFWKTNDRVEWSNLAFEVLEEILRNRINDLPPQNSPVLEYKEEEEDDDLEDWEEKLVDNENQPDFYDTLEVLTLNNNINKLAKIYIVVTIGLTIINFGYVQSLFRGIFPTLQELPMVLLSIIITVVAVGIDILLVYYSLRALAYILRILVEMEFNSRGAKSN